MSKLRFMDFCAGIGGGRLGLVQNGLTCVAYSEIDEVPAKTYELFFGKNENNWWDLTKINPIELPDFDLLIGGFPCQTFSVMGKREGFHDQRGLIIYSLIEIMKKKDVPFFILENVKGLTNHDGGNTFNEIVKSLNEAGYHVYYRVLDSIDYGVPQMRERIYFVGIKKGMAKREFRWPLPFKNLTLSDCLVDVEAEVLDIQDTTFQKYLNNKYNAGKFDIKELLKNDYLVIDTRQSDLRLYRDKVPTLRTGRHGILYVRNQKLIRLSGYESLLLQGFPKEFAEKARKANINSRKLLSQAGNAMTVSVIEAIGKELLECIGE